MDAAVGQVPVEAGLKFGPVAGLDRLDPGRELVQQEIGELDGTLAG
jgi:hypothetical protein